MVLVVVGSVQFPTVKAFAGIEPSDRPRDLDGLASDNDKSFPVLIIIMLSIGSCRCSSCFGV